MWGDRRVDLQRRSSWRPNLSASSVRAFADGGFNTVRLSAVRVERERHTESFFEQGRDSLHFS